MCINLPGKIVEIKKNEFTIAYGSEKRKVNLSLVDELKLEEYVIVSNKIIIARVPQEKAEKFLDIIGKNAGV